MLEQGHVVEPGTAADAAQGFNAGEVIIGHVSNSSPDHPLIHLPPVFGIDMSVTMASNDSGAARKAATRWGFPGVPHTPCGYPSPSRRLNWPAS